MGGLQVTKVHYEGYGQDALRYLSIITCNEGHSRSPVTKLGILPLLPNRTEIFFKIPFSIHKLEKSNTELNIQLSSD